MKKKVIAVAQYIALLMTSVFPATALAEGGTEQEAPVCICENKCSEGNMNADCPVCSAAADFSACQGQEPQPMNEQGGGDTTPADGQGGSGIVTSASGLCEHHTQHDESCGYTEGTAEIPCSHEHTEDCYTLVTKCVHTPYGRLLPCGRHRYPV